MNTYSKENVSHGSKISQIKEMHEFIKFVIQKPRREIPVAKAVISLRVFAVDKKRNPRI